MDYTTTKFLLVMIAVNIVLYFGQGAIEAHNPGVDVINIDDSPLSGYNESTDTTIPDSGSTEEFSGTSSARNEIRDNNNLWTVIKSVFTQPVGFMKSAGVPQPITVAFGFIWYIIFVWMLLQFLIPFIGDDRK